MVRIDRVVTRGGDGGQTSLGDGTRVGKDHLRVEAYGTVDEANAAVGILRLYSTEDAEVDGMLARVQNDLFDIGADLCVPGAAGDRLRVGPGMAARLEAEIEAVNAGLPPLTSFILPGGTAGAAHAHLARTIVKAGGAARGSVGGRRGGWWRGCKGVEQDERSAVCFGAAVECGWGCVVGAWWGWMSFRCAARVLEFVTV